MKTSCSPAGDIVSAGCPPQLGSSRSFTDGSFDGQCSSWAFLILGWADGFVHVIGRLVGTVETNSDAELFVGARSHDALRGEVSALFWALAWLIQGPKLTSILVWSDFVLCFRLCRLRMSRLLMWVM